MHSLTKIARKASELDLAQIERKEVIDKMEMTKNVIYRGIHQDIIESVATILSSLIVILTTCRRRAALCRLELFSFFADDTVRMDRNNIGYRAHKYMKLYLPVKKRKQS